MGLKTPVKNSVSFNVLTNDTDAPRTRHDGQLEIKAKNAEAVRLHGWENDPGTRVTIDGQKLIVNDRPPMTPPMTPPMILTKGKDGWGWTFFDTPPREAVEAAEAAGKILTYKKHLRQGPIDDAFMGPFLVVTPSGKSKNERVQQWVKFELEHFRSRWRALYRGEVRVKQDSEVTEDDVRNYHCSSTASILGEFFQRSDRERCVDAGLVLFQ